MFPVDPDTGDIVQGSIRPMMNGRQSVIDPKYTPTENWEVRWSEFFAANTPDVILPKTSK